MSDEAEVTSEGARTAGERLVADVESWLRHKTLAEAAPRDDVQALVEEVRGDDGFWEKARPRYDKAWQRGEERLRKEQRPARELLSPEAAARLLDAFERADPDPEAVRTFLRSPAIEAMLGSILYTGITEFIKKADLFGNLVNKLPVIGPIRKKVMAVVSEELEGRLEVKIKTFLGGFSGLAVERMIQFVLSDENREGFRKARRRLGEHLLDRPVASLLPGEETTARARDQVWEGLRSSALRDEESWLDELYRDHGGEVVGDWTWELSPRARALLAKPLDRFFASDAGKAWIASLTPPS